MTVGFDGGILWIGVEGRMKRILVFIAIVTLSFACAVSLAETSVVPRGAIWNEAEKLIREQADLIQYVDELDYQIDCLNCHYSTLTSKLIDAMHERGIAVNAWTPDTEGELERVIALGPDGIITNEPGKALDIRNHRK